MCSPPDSNRQPTDYLLDFSAGKPLSETFVATLVLLAVRFQYLRSTHGSK